MNSRGSLPRVQNETMRDIGLVVQIMDNFDLSYIAIENNRFKDIQQELVIDLGTSGQCHCNSISNSLGVEYVQDILSNGTDMIVQLTHLISIKNVRNTLILLANSSFSNLTMTGPIIHIEEREGLALTPIIIARNNFTIIHGQVNSNVITIMRNSNDHSTDDAVQDLTSDGESLDIYEKYYLSFVLFGGSIVITQNRFSYITGCSEVDAGVLYIGVKYDFTYQLQPESYRRNHVLYSQYPSDNLFPYYAGKDGLYLKNPIIQVPSAGGSIFYNRSGVNISGNEYVNVSMGAQRQQDNLIIVGALIKVVNVISVQINDESYLNIGAFTTEFSNYLQNKINFKSTSIQFGKDKINYHINFGIGGFNSFFQTYLSQTLISVESTTLVILGEENYFENIWLIDRADALSRSQNMGILLRVDYLIGSVIIGSSTGDPTKILNIIGYLNAQTLDDPGYLFNISASVQSNKFAQYGAGAPLFHIHSQNNQITEVVFQNMILQNLFFTANKTYPDGDTVKMPAIFSTDLQDKTYSKVPYLVTISQIKLFDIQVDGVFQYFNLLGRNLQIDSLTVEGIGSLDIASIEPRLDLIATRDRVGEVQLEENVCFMKLNLFTKTEFGDVAYASQALFNNMRFSQINLRKAGLPIFMIDRSYDQAPKLITYVNVTNIQVYGQYFDENNAAQWEYIPDTFLFTVLNSKPIQLQMNFFQARLALLYSYYGLFVTLNFIEEVNFYQSTLYYLQGVKASILYAPAYTINKLRFIDTYLYGFDFIALSYGNFLAEADNSVEKFIRPSLLKLDNVKLVEIIGCYVGSNHYASKGAFIDMSQGTNLIVNYTQIESMSAASGGVLAIAVDSNATISDCYFISNSAIQEGVLSVNVQSNVQIYSSTFQSNQALINAVLKVSGDSNILIQDCTFSDNQAEYKNSIGSFFQIKSYATIIGSTFYSNRAYINDVLSSNQLGKLIDFIAIQAPIIIQDCQIYDNTAFIGTPNLYFFDTSQVSIQGTDFSNKYKTTAATNTQVNGNFIQIISSATMKIFQCSFLNGNAASGGAIYVQGEARVTIQNMIIVQVVSCRNLDPYDTSVKQLMRHDNQFCKIQELISNLKQGYAVYFYSSKFLINIFRC